jgi:hypothetical protein
VPDLDWIVSADAFWDFCYEHCNYFAEPSLRLALTRAGFTPIDTRVAFGAQYRWMEAVTADVQPHPEAGMDRIRASTLAAYASRERDAIQAARRRLAAVKAAGSATVIWGMATKGIIFSLLVDPDSTAIDIAVDININKQGCYVPTTGRVIESPGALLGAGGRRLAVMVMNMNYADEIRASCDALGLDAEFFDATGMEVAAA